MASPLDNPTWASLTGPHARFAERHGQAVRYQLDVAPFLAVPDRPDDAVCTDPAHRGQGLATRLVRAVAAGIRARGEIPLMHAAASNTSAIRLYESLGFRLRRRTRFIMLRVPADVDADRASAGARS
ncbi:hypothetical protein ALI22I_14090 [Saccharothrix sp. ALI-22-I]|uniref:GNAT family N-acetyltransferase n=1 Tax=Saccharothrix sp. ALI-22-I TaxID=1933778 RepID=UPI00097CA045|nr:GNAT family N-acetyltransferase [Saccharothrix sp. ALI-22-I]ONI90032.1 hypothetical protein ALI22I_14090 [Saccharothrix sp. ALI-22-I]